MPSEKDKRLEFKHYMKSNKTSYIISANIESLITKINECENNKENSSAIKIGEHITCEYSMPAIWGFDHIEDKQLNEIDGTISYKIKFINSARFMASSLSNLVDNLTERIHKVKCKGCGCFLEYKRNLIIHNVYLAINVSEKSLMEN